MLNSWCFSIKGIGNIIPGDVRQMSSSYKSTLVWNRRRTGCWSLSPFRMLSMLSSLGPFCPGGRLKGKPRAGQRVRNTSSRGACPQFVSEPAERLERVRFSSRSKTAFPILNPPLLSVDQSVTEDETWSELSEKREV